MNTECPDTRIGFPHPRHSYVWQGMLDGESTMQVLWCEGVEEK